MPPTPNLLPGSEAPQLRTFPKCVKCNKSTPDLCDLNRPFGERCQPSAAPCAGGFFFAKPMRENNYVTMMDPFQKKYGDIMSSVLILPTLVADVLWVARTLVSLGELRRLSTLQPCISANLGT